MLEVVLPFGLPPAELARDLTGQLRLPNLTRLFERAGSASGREFAPYSPQLPHEQWLTDRLGSQYQRAAGLAQRNGISLAAGYWFIIHPVHLHIARDHLVLTDARQLNLDPGHARQLFDAAQSCFAEAGLHLLWAEPQAWLVQADGWATLQTSSLDAACGHNIDIWLPKGEPARLWRKLQNEVQMVWFEHPANQARLQQGQPPVNSIWLDGCSSLPSVSSVSAGNAAPPLLLPADWRGQPWEGSTDAILLLDQLSGPALAGDWAEWLLRYAELDQTSLAAVLQPKQCRLVLSNSLARREWLCQAHLGWRFWHRPGLAPLLPA